MPQLSCLQSIDSGITCLDGVLLIHSDHNLDMASAHLQRWALACTISAYSFSFFHRAGKQIPYADGLS